MKIGIQERDREEKSKEGHTLDHWPLDMPEESGQYTSQAGIRVKGSIHLGRELLIVIRLQNLRVSDRDLHRRVHHLRVICEPR